MRHTVHGSEDVRTPAVPLTLKPSHPQTGTCPPGTHDRGNDRLPGTEMERLDTFFYNTSTGFRVVNNANRILIE